MLQIRRRTDIYVLLARNLQCPKGGDEETRTIRAKTGDTQVKAGAGGYKFQKLESRMHLSWAKCAGGEWCLLDEVNLAAVEGHGVFAIWRNGDVAHMTVVLYVGRGALAQEIGRCRRDPLFHAHEVRITWATVDDVRLIDGIVAYLYRELRPLWGEVAPWSDAVRVNLPAA